MKKLSILFILFFITDIFSLDLQFFREDLSFEIKEDHFYVDGLYYFRNISNKELKQRLIYPFPQDSAYGKVDSLFMINVIDSTITTNLQIGDKGASFTIQIDPDSTAVYRIGYLQELKDKKAEYILTTTQTWGRPFEQVNYTLTFPKELSLDSISYMPDSLREESNRYIFFWYKENFMPDRNFIIHFSKKEE
ncbi:MAG: DUF4424 family protein [Candidatus Cloacimonetes bacterium]|nr:DUF4424 family protein [Candidatus Cloacimonadota bacterium]MBL7149668.1 DUF4424 family protein [Candidatus Cloacimonadota bacterium]